jgi:hypothetical protein
MNVFNNLFLIALTFVFIQIEPSSVFAKTCEKEGVAVKLGFDMPSKLEYSGDVEGSDNVKVGFSGSAEYAFGINKMISAGGGILYQLPRAIDETDSSKSKFNFLDFYGAINFVFPLDIPNFDIYATAHLGYDYMMGNSAFKEGGSLNGGLNWAIGAGVLIYKNIIVEALYNVNTGTWKDEGYKTDMKYSVITFVAGYQF